MKIAKIEDFVDASKIITKKTTLAERDKALKDGEEALNNDIVSQFAYKIKKFLPLFRYGYDI